MEHVSVPPIHYLTPEEGREIFDRQARRYLGISSDEFVERWDSGYYDDDPERVMRVAMLLPLVRRERRRESRD